MQMQHFYVPMALIFFLALVVGFLAYEVITLRTQLHRQGDGFVVTNKQGTAYRTVAAFGAFMWTTDPTKALRFYRHEDATRYLPSATADSDARAMAFREIVTGPSWMHSPTIDGWPKPPERVVPILREEVTRMRHPVQCRYEQPMANWECTREDGHSGPCAVREKPHPIADAKSHL